MALCLDASNASHSNSSGSIQPKIASARERSNRKLYSCLRRFPDVPRKYHPAYMLGLDPRGHQNLPARTPVANAEHDIFARINPLHPPTAPVRTMDRLKNLPRNQHQASRHKINLNRLTDIQLPCPSMKR